ncbi:MAG TPA: tetratricopeptide repeat protein [Pirellulales bacterium]|nr:tetratricopeptide repeat protein [Pirellulales bacterium]
MKSTRSPIAFAALMLLAGGWYVAGATPERRFQGALRSLRASDAENVQYQILAVAPREESQARASLLRGWLMLEATKADEPGRNAAVMDELGDAADDEQHRALALALMGRVRYEEGKLADALVLLDRSLQLDRDEVEAHRWLGIALYDIGLARPAVFHLEEVARQEPWNGRPHHLMGIIHRERAVVSGEALAFEDAAAAFKESLARDPQQPNADEIRIELGRCYFYRNEFDQALEAVRPCFDAPESLVLRAECYYGKGDVDRANQCVDLALEQNPDDSRALSVKATIATKGRDFQQAATLLARAVQGKPSDYDLRYKLFSAYQHIGENEKAAEQAEEMEKLRGMYSELQVLTARASADLSDADIRYRLAELATRLDMRESAESWLKAAKMLDSPDLRRRLAQGF